MSETYRPAFGDGRTRPMLSYGLPFAEAAAKHVSQTFHAKRVYIICSGSLSRNTDNLEKLRMALGEAVVVGVRIGMKSHTLWSEILDITAEARRLEIDLIVTLGGGSITDGAKIISYALANDVTTADELDTLTATSLNKRDSPKPPTVPIVCVPTSLSGGELSDFAGGTDDRTHHKKSFSGGTLKGPALIVYDPELAKTTPASVWLSSGVRGLDHCVETLCSLQSNARCDEDARQGLAMLVPGLLRTKTDPEFLPPRLQCQLGLAHAMSAASGGVPLGASHGIGHQLGPMGVGHGETSCILLPAVCKFNAAKGANVDRQNLAADVLWGVPQAVEVFTSRRLQKETADLGDLVDAIIRALGMPRSLVEVGLKPDQFDGIAEHSLKDRWVISNPYSIRKKEEVLEILQAVAG